MNSSNHAFLAIAFAAVAFSCGANGGCLSQPTPVGSSDESAADVPPDGVVINGVVVAPALIRPGTRVTLRDPTPVDPSRLAPLHYWNACDGTIDTSVESYGAQTTWVAPSTTGPHAVTMSVANTASGQRSIVIPLCVTSGDAPCTASVATLPLSLTASPSALTQETDCGGAACATQVTSTPSGTDGGSVTYRWLTRRGAITGSGDVVAWTLPTVGCCTETFNVAVTACAGSAGVGAGLTHVVVYP